jgi:hypothetical protein
MQLRHCVSLWLQPRSDRKKKKKKKFNGKNIASAFMFLRSYIAADSLHFCEQGAEQIHVFASPASALMTCRHHNVVVAATNGFMPPAYGYVS